MPSFSEVYDLLQKKGPAHVVSSRGTVYRVEARETRDGRKAIIGFLSNNASVYVFEYDWLNDITKAQTRAGGLYHGQPSITDWYQENR